MEKYKNYSEAVRRGTCVGLGTHKWQWGEGASTTDKCKRISRQIQKNSTHKYKIITPQIQKKSPHKCKRISRQIQEIHRQMQNKYQEI